MDHRSWSSAFQNRRSGGTSLRRDTQDLALRLVKAATEVVTAYWAAANARDWGAFGDLLADDVVYEGPQTRERVRGRDSYVRFNVEGFPGDWHLDVVQIIGQSLHAVQLDRVHERRRQHPARAVLLRAPRRRQDRSDHRLLAGSLRAARQPGPPRREVLIDWLNNIAVRPFVRANGAQGGSESFSRPRFDCPPGRGRHRSRVRREAVRRFWEHAQLHVAARRGKPPRHGEVVIEQDDQGAPIGERRDRLVRSGTWPTYASMKYSSA